MSQLWASMLRCKGVPICLPHTQAALQGLFLHELLLHDARQDAACKTAQKLGSLAPM